MEKDFQAWSEVDLDLFVSEVGVTASEKIKVFSPLYFLRRMLTADDFLESEAYAHVVIRAEIYAAAVRSFAPPTGANIYEYIADAIRFEKISKSLTTIESYIGRRDSFYMHTITDFIVGNLLASQGYGHYALERTDTRGQKRRRSERAWMSLNEFLSRADIAFTDNAGYEIKFVSDLDVLPSASQILADLDGIPIAVPGARTIFSGGIRTTESNGSVVRITGKSGTGKTTLALALCTALAPLGTRSFYLSCEEEEEDLVDRIYSVTPGFINKMRNYSAPRANEPPGESWFTAYHLDDPNSAENLDAVDVFIDAVLDFYESNNLALDQKRPPGIVPFVVVLDGVHEVINSEQAEQAVSQLHQLVQRLRELNALVVLLSADVDSHAFRSLDYLVDVVVRLDSLDGSGNAFEKLRSFRLEKTRRQFSNTGNHRYHISKQGGVKIYPNLPSILETFKRTKWQEANTASYFDFLGAQDPNVARELRRPWLKIFQKSHTLITGKGSSGKASFALRLLTSPLRTNGTNETLFSEGRSRRAPFYRRILIVSFLYPESYYSTLLDRLRRAKFSDRLGRVPTPDIAYHVIGFYPGFLQPEVLLGKISDEIQRGNIDGFPYDSILIDGLHNVFLQFPGIESSTLIWPVLSEIFRRCGLTVAITHAHFNVIGMDHDRDLGHEVRTMANRSVPLLQNLVNSADYYLDVSPAPMSTLGGSEASTLNGSITVATALGQPIPRRAKIWNRSTLTVEDPAD